MPSERDVVIKISRILLHDTFCIVNETDVSITQYLVKICYARSKKAGEKSERKTTFTRVCSHTQRLVICHAVELLVLRRDTKEQKLLRQVTHTHIIICNQIKIKYSMGENMPKTLHIRVFQLQW